MPLLWLRAVWAYFVFIPVALAGMLLYILQSDSVEPMVAAVSVFGVPVGSFDSQSSVAPSIIAGFALFLAVASFVVPLVIHRIERVRAVVQLPFFVALGLAEPAALLGFLFGVMRFGRETSLALIGISLVSIALRFPTEKVARRASVTIPSPR